MAIARPGYERFGLLGNPFQELASESLDDADLLHVCQEADEVLRGFKEEVIERQRRVFALLLGELGTGKTQRLLVAQSEAIHLGAFECFHQVSTEGKHALARLVRDLIESCKDQKRGGGLVTPKWLRDLQNLAKKAKRNYDPEDAGRVLAAALNENAPGFLLLNDMQNMEGNGELDRWLQTLHTLANHLRPGTMVLGSCYPRAYVRMVKRQPQLDTRVDRRFVLKGLVEDEARHIIAKRLPAKRVIDDLDPVYPFDGDAIRLMNQACSGNPRELLRLADRVLEDAVERKAFHVGAEDVDRVIPQMTKPPERPVVGTDPTSRKEVVVQATQPRSAPVASKAPSGKVASKPQVLKTKDGTAVVRLPDGRVITLAQYKAAVAAKKAA